MNCLCVCLIKGHLSKSPVSFHWSTLTCLSRHRPHQLLQCFCNHSYADGIVEGGDCIAVTSQPYRHPDGLFEGTIQAVCISSQINCFDNFTEYILYTKHYALYKKDMKITLFIVWNLKTKLRQKTDIRVKVTLVLIRMVLLAK